MKRVFIKAYNELKKIGAPVFKEYDGGSPVERGSFKISGESGEGWADYWEPDLGEFGVSMKIVDVLNKNGLYPEWENAGVLNVYEV